MLELPPLDRAAEDDRQQFHFDRLGDEVVGPRANGGNGRFQVAEGRHHDDRHVGPVGHQPRTELQAVHARHLQVGQHGLEILAAGGLEGLGRGSEAPGREIPQPQIGFQQIAHAPLVVDDQDSRLQAFGSLRQVDGETTPFADAAGHVDPAAVLLHDAIGDRQAQAGAGADLLGGEERFEKLLQVLLGDADALVADFDGVESRRAASAVCGRAGGAVSGERTAPGLRRAWPGWRSWRGSSTPAGSARHRFGRRPLRRRPR